MSRAGSSADDIVPAIVTFENMGDATGERYYVLFRPAPRLFLSVVRCLWLSGQLILRWPMPSRQFAVSGVRFSLYRRGFLREWYIAFTSRWCGMTASRESSDISPCDRLMISPDRVVGGDQMVSRKGPSKPPHVLN